MTGSSFPAWLAAQAAQREERGLTRRLTEASHASAAAGLAPAAAGAALAALHVIEAAPELVSRARANAAILAGACGIDAPAGAVLSVPMPGPREALASVANAAEHGLRIGCFRPPSTPDGISRLRLTAHAHHTGEELALAAKILHCITPGTRR